MLCGLVTIRWPSGDHATLYTMRWWPWERFNIGYCLYYHSTKLYRKSLLLSICIYCHKCAAQVTMVINVIFLCCSLILHKSIVWKIGLYSCYSPTVYPLCSPAIPTTVHSSNLPVHLCWVAVPVCFLWGHRVWCDCCPVVPPVHAYHHGRQTVWKDEQ